jgi:hypothetical protein
MIKGVFEIAILYTKSMILNQIVENYLFGVAFLKSQSDQISILSLKIMSLLRDKSPTYNISQKDMLRSAPDGTKLIQKLSIRHSYPHQNGCKHPLYIGTVYP